MISLKDLGEFFLPSPKCFLLGTIQKLAAELTQDKTKAGGWGLMDGAWLDSFGGPGRGGGLQTFMAVPSGGDLGRAAFSRWKGDGKKPTMGHPSPYVSDMNSEVSLIQSFNEYY